MNHERQESGITLSAGRKLISYLLKCGVVGSAAVGVILSAMASASILNSMKRRAMGR